MDLFIKSFNRAYLLHRTLESIRKNLLGFEGRIIVLDDGTPQIYLDELLSLFPEIEIRKSPYYFDKSKAITDNKSPKNVVPTDFWKAEVMKGTDFFILIEDDTWFSKPVDFQLLKPEVELMQMDMVKFMWLGNSKLISKNSKDSGKLINKVVPELCTQNSLLFDFIFRSNRFKGKTIANMFYNLDEALLKYYQFYIVAGGVFSKRYYQTCWKESSNKVDELQQISQLLKSRKKFNVGNTVHEVLKTTIKTTSSMMAKNHLGSTVDIHKVNQILNKAWMNGKRYEITDFESDLPSKWIENQLENDPEEGKALAQQWRQWYEVFEASYKNIGCNF